MFNFPNQISDSETKELFDILYKKNMSNNSSYFHFNMKELSSVSKEKCLDKFKQNIAQYNNIIANLSANDNVKKSNRKTIKKILIDYEEIVNSINVYKAVGKDIPYVYEYLLKKLIRQIIRDNISSTAMATIDILNNDIEINDINNSEKHYKLIKFIQKFQLLYPEKYKKYTASLIISNNWKDILFQSTFKQWTSCTNILNSSVDKFLSYTPYEEILNQDMIAYLVLDNDMYDINYVMDDIGPRKFE